MRQRFRIRITDRGPTMLTFFFLGKAKVALHNSQVKISLIYHILGTVEALLISSSSFKTSLALSLLIVWPS